jgi:Integral membrane protein TerC family
MRSVRLLRLLMSVTDEYRGTRLWVRADGRCALTLLTVVVVAVLATDVVFAVDSVPAVYGVTEDPYLVFATNAFALLGLRALYFVLQSALSKLSYLNHGLALILALIGVKLMLHWAHGLWPAVPEIPSLMSLAVIVLILAIVAFTSAVARRRAIHHFRPGADHDPRRARRVRATGPRHHRSDRHERRPAVHSPIVASTTGPESASAHTQRAGLTADGRRLPSTPAGSLSPTAIRSLPNRHRR